MEQRPLRSTIDSETKTGEHAGEQVALNSSFSRLFPGELAPEI
jgi:hypothetical protein